MRVLTALAAFVAVGGGALLAHDVPDAVAVTAFVRPAGQRVQMLVRVPLAAMRDVDVPTDSGGYLDFPRVESTLRHAATIWLTQNIEIFEEGTLLASPRLAAVRVSLPSDVSFREFGTALAHVTGPGLNPSTRLYWDQGVLDALIEYPITSEASRFSIRTEFRRLAQRVTIGLRFLPRAGAERAFQIHDEPGIVALDPRWHQAAAGFVWSGIAHVLSGPDHLLFLLLVVLPLRRVRPLVIIVTSFTVAHAVTLIAAAYGFVPQALWFVPLVETLIAVSIVWLAIENIVRVLPATLFTSGREGPLAPDGLGRRWAITTAFGLVHGFGFSFALQERLQFAGAHLLTSLVAFNVGVEVAQVAVIVTACLALRALFARVVAESSGTLVISALVAHTGWHWMLERGDVLRQYSWPTLGAGEWARVVVVLMAALVVAACVWMARVAGRTAGLTGVLDRR
jgi:hypothetical protein